MDPSRLEPRLGGELAEDQEGAGAREAAALRVEEELRTVAHVQERASLSQVAPERVRGSVRRRRGRSSSAAGLPVRTPSSAWWRKKERIAATRRAIVEGDRPA